MGFPTLLPYTCVFRRFCSGLLQVLLKFGFSEPACRDLLVVLIALNEFLWVYVVSCVFVTAASNS